MRWPIVLILSGVLAFNVGLVFGALLSYAGTARNSYDVWQVTNTDGATYYLTDAAEVEAARRVDDGMLAVQRLRVLA